MLKADIHSELGNTVDLSVIDHTSGEVMAENNDILSNGVLFWNLSMVDPMDHRTIKLKVQFNHVSGGEPLIRSLSLSWLPNNSPSIGNLISPAGVYRTDAVQIIFDIKDPDQGWDFLEVEVACRSGSADPWMSDLFSTPHYNEAIGSWETTFSPEAITPGT